MLIYSKLLVGLKRTLPICCCLVGIGKAILCDAQPQTQRLQSQGGPLKSLLRLGTWANQDETFNGQKHPQEFDSLSIRVKIGDQPVRGKGGGGSNITFLVVFYY